MGSEGAPEQVRISASPQGPQPVSQSFRRSLSDDSLRREWTSSGWLEPSSWLICFLWDRAPGNHQAISGGSPFLTTHQTFVFRKVLSPQTLKNPLWDQLYLRILEFFFLLSPTRNATFECLLAQVWNLMKRDSHFSGYRNWAATVFLCRDVFYLKR